MTQTIITIALVLILLTLLNPGGFFMPETIDMLLALFLVVIFLVFSALVWREQGGDERDQLHRLSSGRVSFFIGTNILALGIVLQALRHNIDPWLVYTLIGMVIAKAAASLYHQNQN